MKKVVVFLLTLTLGLITSTGSVFAESKVGINIGAHHDDFDAAASLVGAGGWIVMMACPGDGDIIAEKVKTHPEINLVIRGHFPGQTLDQNLAKTWAAVLASIPFSSKVYFMPWNEPNHSNEGGGPTAGNLAYQYGVTVQNEFTNAGILGNKVILLSPMVDKLNSSFIDGSFFTNPGGKSGFYDFFDGSSINEYDQFVSGPCSASPPANNCEYDNPQVGIPGNHGYYALEAGVVSNCAPPCYKDEQLGQMLDRSWQKWGPDSNFKMFAIFSYDPHRPTSWNIFSSDRVKNFITNHREGCCTKSISPTSSSTGLKTCPGKKYSFYVGSESECKECGSAAAEVIVPENSLVCTDFNIDYEHTEEKHITPIPAPSGVQATSQSIFDGIFGTTTGNLDMKEEKAPNFSQTEKRLSLAFPHLLPQDLLEQVYVDKTPLKTNAQHFVFGKDKDGNPTALPTQIPETKVEQPWWWTSLLGQTKIISGFVNPIFPGTGKWAVKVQQPTAIPTFSAGNLPPCDSKERAANESQDLALVKEEFETQSWWKTIIDRLINLIRTKKETHLANKSREPWVGGKTLETQSALFDFSLNEDQINRSENTPLNTESKFDVSVEGHNADVGEGAKEVKYQEQSLIRRRFCLQLCSLYPSRGPGDPDSIDISKIDPLCTSCDANDYP